MLDRIVEHVFDLLENDSRMLTGGFPAITRVSDDTDTPVAGNINLFEYAFEDDSKEARPAVYFGTRNAQGTDRDEFEAVAAGRLVNYRIAVVPLLVCCVGARGAARTQRRQIVANIRAVLTDVENVVQDNFWYLLKEKVDTGGFRNSGGGNRGNNESRILLNFEISYKYVAGTVIV